MQQHVSLWGSQIHLINIYFAGGVGAPGSGDGARPDLGRPGVFPRAKGSRSARSSSYVVVVVVVVYSRLEETHKRLQVCLSEGGFG